MRPARSLLLLVATTVALPLATAQTGSALAATKTVDAGVPRSLDRSFRKYGTDANAFFPSRLTIRVGDKLAFRPSGFHAIHLLSRRGGAPLPPFVASADRVSGAIDAAGTPFWFNGQPEYDTAPSMRRSRFGTQVSFTGAKPVFSGLQGKGTSRPLTVTFKRSGTYTFLCDYHHGMKGTVRVVSRSSRAVPSARQDRAAAAKQLSQRLRVAPTLQKKPVPAGVVNVGVAGSGGLEFYDFSPKIAHVKVGGTLEFRMSPGSLETHAVAAGPGLPDTEKASYLGTMARTFETNRPDARAVYASEPDGVTALMSPALHGNGFWSAGLLDRKPGTPFAVSRRVTFPSIGKVVFSCLIHKYMHTLVLVEK
jgi:plastocyanin